VAAVIGMDFALGMDFAQKVKAILHENFSPNVSQVSHLGVSKRRHIFCAILVQI
jgi:hypothetical protein